MQDRYRPMLVTVAPLIPDTVRQSLQVPTGADLVANLVGRGVDHATLVLALLAGGALTLLPLLGVSYHRLPSRRPSPLPLPIYRSELDGRRVAAVHPRQAPSPGRLAAVRPGVEVAVLLARGLASRRDLRRWVAAGALELCE